MKNEVNHQSNESWVLPGDKIAEIEEFLPDENCYEKEGSIYSSIFGRIVTDKKKHKISIVPNKQILSINNGDFGLGRVEFIKKQIASVDIYKIDNEVIMIPITAVLHISEVSRRFVKNMYEVTRPGDWLKFRVIRSAKPVYISLIGNDLGILISYCNHCGHILDYKRRNTLECPNCELIQQRITAKSYGNPLNYKLG